MKLLDDELFKGLKQQAADSPRRRSNVNIHPTHDDPVQRLFISFEPDSYFRPHKHSDDHKWEFFLMIEGEADLLLFDEQGRVEARHHLNASGPLRGLEIPPHTWHALVPRQQAAVFMEVKQGPYQRLDDKDFASWAPEEQQASSAAFLAKLKTAEVGQQLG